MIHFLSPAWKTYPILVPSLVCQTSQNWSLNICHDGPNEDFIKACAVFDSRVSISTTPERTGVWGHFIRKILIEQLVCDPNDLIIISNHDNYCFPNLVQNLELLSEDFICWGCSHNYFGYKVLSPRIEYGKLDVSMVAVRARIAKKVGWKSFLQDSDWLYCQSAWYMADTYKFIPQIMCVHN